MNENEKGIGQVPHIYIAMNSAMQEIHEEGGIAKDRSNAQQRYKFRGIDDVFNALSPILARNKIVIFPRVTNMRTDQHQTKSGQPIFYSYVEVEYDFVSVVDGSQHLVRMTGEGMDVSDKSINKALSSAYKYACFQAFCIPTETGGMEDSEQHTHELANRNQSYQRQGHQQGQHQRPQQQQQQPQQPPQGQAHQARSPEAQKLINDLWMAARKGSAEFRQVWDANDNNARKEIFRDKQLMANFKATVDRVDHQEGNIPNNQQQEAQ